MIHLTHLRKKGLFCYICFMCENLQFDTEGRVSISEKLLKHAKIKTNVYLWD